MFDSLYPLSFIVTLFSLILWFYFRNNRKLSGLMQKLFFGGLIVYLISVFNAPGLMSTKFFALFRDLFAIGVLSQIFNLLKNKKQVFFAMLLVIFGVYQFFGKPYLQNTFSSALSLENEISANGELLVEINENSVVADVEDLFSKYDLTYETAFHPLVGSLTDLDDYLLVDIPKNNSHRIEEIIKELKASEHIDWVELNEVFKINPIESKIRPPSQINYGINDPEVNKQWGFEVLKMDKLYQLLRDQNIQPKQKAKIFIVDSGIDAKHEDLKGRYRSVNADYDIDSNGHGTHCAGIAAAITNNGKGIASVFPSNEFAEVSGIKVMNFLGLITQQRLIEGIIEAVDKGADVISVSIGSKSREAAQEAFQEVVEYADKANAIIVVAAGNDNSNAIDYTPANAEGVITVSAIDTFSDKASFSNMVGGLKMGIAAPGVDIYSTFPGSKYKNLSGTSMACPAVSGLVGLMKSIQPDLTTAEVYQILKDSGTKTGTPGDTGPMIQPAEAVKAILD